MDRLSDVFQATLKAVENGKEEIFDIYETTRSEVKRLQKELAYLKTEISETIHKVEKQQKKERILRKKLMEVNKNFHLHNEQEMIEVYRETKDSQVELQLLQARELQLRSRRDEIERSLKNLEGTAQKAENLINQVSLAAALLRDGVTEFSQFYGNDQKQGIALRIMQVQDEERRRIAREVHDGPAQSLANIVLRLEIAEKLLTINPKQVLMELRDLNGLVRENLMDIRRIIFDLRPINLNNCGIVENIKQYMANYEKTYGIRCQLIIKGTERPLPPPIQVALFRVVQEGMTNAAKHSKTNKAVIGLEFRDDGINGKIIDYGKGFRAEEALAHPGEHYGLIGICERVEMFAGKFSIKSKPGEGTVIEFKLPYSK